MMIVKVQIPLMSTESAAPALVYNEDRTFERFLDVDEDLLKKMDGKPKAFFYVDSVSQDGKAIGLKPAPWQTW